MSQSAWEKTKRYSKKGFDKAWDTVDKLGAPVNRLSNRLGAEAFWPMAIDKESDKAARIIRSFCKDGFYASESEVNTDEHGKINRPKGKQKVMKKIPSQVIQNAKGLAIFTTMRTGLWVSGSGGSGVLLARIPETGEWSPPSGIMLHTAGIGFLAGVDIYDCVVIINTYEALDAFKKVRCTLGGEVSATAGPVGMGGVLESEVHKRQAPIWTYMKSKGLYAGVAIDGTIVIERTDENEKFYGERISVSEILAGKIRHPPDSIKTLHQTIKAAQGDSDVDETLVPPPGETPGDVELQDSQNFGVPAADDPDPYGVKALEAEGLFIREAGTKVRPSPETFEFRPSPGSPIYATFSRRSLDSSPRNSWRTSVQSYTSVNRGTQTDDLPLTATTPVSQASSRSAKESTDIPAPSPSDDEASHWDTVPIHGGEEEDKEERKHDGNVHEKNHDESDTDIEVQEVSNVTVNKRESKDSTPVEEPESKRTSPTFTRARLVTIAKRPTPPALPPRHPRHTWGSGSSRESTSPTALSHSSRSTEPTEAAVEPAEPVEPIQMQNALPPNVKMLQTPKVVPAVVYEDDDDLFDDSDSELPADKDEFLSASGGEGPDEETMTPAEDLTATQPDTDFLSVSAIPNSQTENGCKDDIPSATSEIKSEAPAEPQEGSALAEKLEESLCFTELEANAQERKYEKDDLTHISAGVA
ncbi:hypothetical protein N7532_006826 [Penicillium argentinense]|uniref:Ysc84 actin-binding domain-containing protein n=1 Tax=Penicillium argentinense TaxID=1131581 RepID=A0A9W9KB69_9EURO|nr:uncharacterized protein N7532_006826 [Penicillium argentinense]KAJ5099825.1 hypothetical protein N7532_006826 [Penicillium argentinense]